MEASKFLTGLEAEMNRLQQRFQDMLQSQADLWKADHQAQQTRHTELLQQMGAQIQAINTLAQRPTPPVAGHAGAVIGPVGAPFGEPIRLHKLAADDDIYRGYGPDHYERQFQAAYRAQKERPRALIQGLKRCFWRAGGMYQGPARGPRAGKCFACGKPGHWRQQCPAKRNLTNRAGFPILGLKGGCMIQVKVEGVPVVALLDSGANQSILSQRVWARILKAKGQEIDRPQGKSHIQCMHGTSLPYEIKKVWVEYQGRKHDLNMALMPRPPYEVILGREWPYFWDCFRAQGGRAPVGSEGELAKIFPLEDSILEKPSQKRPKSRSERRADKKACCQSKGGEGQLPWKPWVPYEVAQRFPTLGREQRGDSTLSYAIEQWEEIGRGSRQFQVMGGLLYQVGWNPRARRKQRRLVVPAVFRRQIFWAIHRDLGKAHLPQDPTVKRLQAQFYWPGLEQEVRKWCKECSECNKGIELPTGGGAEASPGSSCKEVQIAVAQQAARKPVLKFMKLSSKARMPARATPCSVGIDLSSIQELKVPKGGRGLVNTGLVVGLPEGCYGRIASRSGLALQHGIHIGAGVIDPDFRGPLKILVMNLGEKEYKIKEGDWIAQLICERAVIPELKEEEIRTDTTRGEQGWGSSDSKVGTGKEPIPKKILLRLGEGHSEEGDLERTNSVLSRGVCDREAPVTSKKTVGPVRNTALKAVSSKIKPISPGKSSRVAQPNNMVEKQGWSQPRILEGRALKPQASPYYSFPQVGGIQVEGGGAGHRALQPSKPQIGRRQSNQRGGGGSPVPDCRSPAANQDSCYLPSSTSQPRKLSGHQPTRGERLPPGKYHNFPSTFWGEELEGVPEGENDLRGLAGIQRGGWEEPAEVQDFIESPNPLEPAWEMLSEEGSGEYMFEEDMDMES
uniref:Gypsy retrotransposon integrase-like protein 1 n=1 Tax=Geotrypetes seraphini TaxID=260995 RepID=A0A6P8QJV6_GEOSA|nr:uncharacterized protein LOC117354149 [Geotrypetes seraphini]